MAIVLVGDSRLPTHYCDHLLCALALLAPLRDLLLPLKSPRADNCFWLEEEAALDFWMVETSLRGLSDWDFEGCSTTLLDKLMIFAGTGFPAIAEAELGFRTMASAGRSRALLTGELSESDDEGLVVLSIS